MPIPRTAGACEVLHASLAAVERGAVVVLATVVARHGSTPSTPGQKLCLVRAAAGGVGGALEATGTVGGGAIELRVLERMVAALDAPPTAGGTRVERFDLGASLGMCCGGSVEILFERLEPALAVLVVGAGHIGVALAPLLAELGFRVVLSDARDGAVERLGGPGRLTALGCDHDDPEVLAAVGAPAAAAVVVVTHDHQLDQAAIEWALGQGFALVGGVGSRAKAARTRDRLEARGVGAAERARVRMPFGVEIGARTPLEIAVAVAGELVAWRAARLGTSRHLPVASPSVAPVAPVDDEAE
ncbi:MAG: XdhC family protein [Myxococcales bacterium]|nr:XdhC family protein [Myxococcales bacterium]